MKNEKSIFRKEHKKNYTVIDNDLLKDKDLSDSAHRLLVLALTLPDDWYFTRKNFIEWLGYSERKVGTIIKELKVLGYVSVHQFPNSSGTNFTTKYRFYESKNANNRKNSVS